MNEICNMAYYVVNPNKGKLIRAYLLKLFLVNFLVTEL